MPKGGKKPQLLLIQQWQADTKDTANGTFCDNSQALP